MTSAYMGIVLPVGGVILELIPSTRVSPGENPVHLLDEQRRRFWRATLLKALLMETLLGQAAEGLPLAWRGGSVQVASLMGVVELMRRRPTSCWRPGVASCFVGLTACSGQRWLALLFSCQCSAGQRRRAALVAMTMWDDLACSGLWWAVQLHCGFSGAVHRQKTVQVTTCLVSMTTEAAHASGATR